MTWKKQAPKSWEWFQDVIYPQQAESVAEACARIAGSKQLIKFIVGPFPNSAVMIISCRGTPIPKTPKAKAEEEAE